MATLCIPGYHSKLVRSFFPNAASSLAVWLPVLCSGWFCLSCRNSSQLYSLTELYYKATIVLPPKWEVDACPRTMAGCPSSAGRGEVGSSPAAGPLGGSRAPHRSTDPWHSRQQAMSQTHRKNTLRLLIQHVARGSRRHQSNTCHRY